MAAKIWDHTPAPLPSNVNIKKVFMGYTIKIGEMVSKTESDGVAYFNIKPEKHDTAPAFGEITDFTNERWPSYTAWYNFIREVGLEQLFSTDLFKSHPGIVELTPDHQEQIRAALNRRRKQFPQAYPGFQEDDFGKPLPNSSNADPMLVRLIWLDYWVSWALTNCERPAISNS